MQPRSVPYSTEGWLRVERKDGVETRTAPTSIHHGDEFIGRWERRWRRNEVVSVTGWGSEIGVKPGRTVESTHIKR